MNTSAAARLKIDFRTSFAYVVRFIFARRCKSKLSNRSHLFLIHQREQDSNILDTGAVAKGSSLNHGLKAAINHQTVDGLAKWKHNFVEDC
jgi:hypothetical protein